MNITIHTRLNPKTSTSEDQKVFSRSFSGEESEVDMAFLKTCVESHREQQKLPIFCGVFAYEYAKNYCELMLIAELLNDRTPKKRYTARAHNMGGNCLIEFSSNTAEYVPYSKSGRWD